MRVTRVEELSPTMRRLVLTGADLEPEFPFPALAATDHVKVVFPDPGTGEIVLSRPGESGPAPIRRDYTIRRVDHSTRELTLDFVLHPHGPAGQWATKACPGDEIGVLGPRGSQVYPASCADYLIVADETGLPATERFLEELPLEVVVRVVVLAPPESTPRELGGGREAGIQWLPTHDMASAADAIVDAVAGLPIGEGTFAWAAGEAGVMRALRRHLRDDRKVDADRIAVRGYWRTGITGALPPEEE